MLEGPQAEQQPYQEMTAFGRDSSSTASSAPQVFEILPRRPGGRGGSMSWTCEPHSVWAASTPSPAPPSAVSYSGLSAASRSARRLDADSRRLLDRIGSGPSQGIDWLLADRKRSRTELKPGTLLTREWEGHLQRVIVLADGFSWNDKTYPSLSKVPRGALHAVAPRAKWALEAGQ